MGKAGRSDLARLQGDAGRHNSSSEDDHTASRKTWALAHSLFESVARDDLDAARGLLASTHALNLRDKAGRTVLHVACACRAIRCIEFLLDKHSDVVNPLVYDYESGWTPLHYAIYHAQTAMVMSLLRHQKRKASITLQGDYAGSTPFHLLMQELDVAATRHHNACADVLTQYWGRATRAQRNSMSDPVVAATAIAAHDSSDGIALDRDGSGPQYSDDPLAALLVSAIPHQRSAAAGRVPGRQRKQVVSAKNRWQSLALFADDSDGDEDDDDSGDGDDATTHGSRVMSGQRLKQSTVHGAERQQPPGAEFSGAAFVWGSNYNYVLGVSDGERRTKPQHISFMPLLSSLTTTTSTKATVAKIAVSNRAGDVVSSHDSRLIPGVRPASSSAAHHAVKRKRTIDPSVGVVQVATDKYHTLFCCSNGEVYGCGHNFACCLGSKKDSAVFVQPTRLVLPIKCTAVAVGRSHSLFLSDRGTVYGCGGNMHGQLGQSSTSITIANPIQLVIGNGREVVTHIAASKVHSVFMTRSGVYACGKQQGQLGLNLSAVPADMPCCDIHKVPLMDGEPTDISAAEFVTAIAVDGKLVLLSNYKVKTFSVPLVESVGKYTLHPQLQDFTLVRTCKKDYVLAITSLGTMFLHHNGALQRIHWKNDLVCTHVIDAAIGYQKGNVTVLVATAEGQVFQATVYVGSESTHPTSPHVGRGALHPTSPAPMSSESAATFFSHEISVYEEHWQNVALHGGHQVASSFPQATTMDSAVHASSTPSLSSSAIPWKHAPRLSSGEGEASLHREHSQAEEQWSNNTRMLVLSERYRPIEFSIVPELFQATSVTCDSAGLHFGVVRHQRRGLFSLRLDAAAGLPDLNRPQANGGSRTEQFSSARLRHMSTATRMAAETGLVDAQVARPQDAAFTLFRTSREVLAAVTEWAQGVPTRTLGEALLSSLASDTKAPPLPATPLREWMMRAFPVPGACSQQKQQFICATSPAVAVTDWYLHASACTSGDHQQNAESTCLQLSQRDLLTLVASLGVALGELPPSMTFSESAFDELLTLHPLCGTSSEALLAFERFSSFSPDIIVVVPPKHASTTEHCSNVPSIFGLHSFVLALRPYASFIMDAILSKQKRRSIIVGSRCIQIGIVKDGLGENDVALLMQLLYEGEMPFIDYSGLDQPAEAPKQTPEATAPVQKQREEIGSAMQAIIETFKEAMGVRLKRIPSARKAGSLASNSGKSSKGTARSQHGVDGSLHTPPMHGSPKSRRKKGKKKKKKKGSDNVSVAPTITLASRSEVQHPSQAQKCGKGQEQQQQHKLSNLDAKRGVASSSSPEAHVNRAGGSIADSELPQTQDTAAIMDDASSLHNMMPPSTIDHKKCLMDEQQGDACIDSGTRESSTADHAASSVTIGREVKGEKAAENEEMMNSGEDDNENKDEDDHEDEDDEEEYEDEEDARELALERKRQEEGWEDLEREISSHAVDETETTIHKVRREGSTSSGSANSSSEEAEEEEEEIEEEANDDVAALGRKRGQLPMVKTKRKSKKVKESEIDKRISELLTGDETKRREAEAEAVIGSRESSALSAIELMDDDDDDDDADEENDDDDDDDDDDGSIRENEADIIDGGDQVDTKRERNERAGEEHGAVASSLEKRFAEDGVVPQAPSTTLTGSDGAEKDDRNTSANLSLSDQATQFDGDSGSATRVYSRYRQESHPFAAALILLCRLNLFELADDLIESIKAHSRVKQSTKYKALYDVLKEMLRKIRKHHRWFAQQIATRAASTTGSSESVLSVSPSSPVETLEPFRGGWRDPLLQRKLSAKTRQLGIVLCTSTAIPCVFHAILSSRHHTIGEREEHTVPSRWDLSSSSDGKESGYLPPESWGCCQNTRSDGTRQLLASNDPLISLCTFNRNVFVQCADDSVFYVHSFALQASSEYYCALFNSTWIPSSSAAAVESPAGSLQQADVMHRITVDLPGTLWARCVPLFYHVDVSFADLTEEDLMALIDFFDLVLCERGRDLAQDALAKFLSPHNVAKYIEFARDLHCDALYFACLHTVARNLDMVLSQRLIHSVHQEALDDIERIVGLVLPRRPFHLLDPLTAHEIPSSPPACAPHPLRLGSSVHGPRHPVNVASVASPAQQAMPPAQHRNQYGPSTSSPSSSSSTAARTEQPQQVSSKMPSSPLKSAYSALSASEPTTPQEAAKEQQQQQRRRQQHPWGTPARVPTQRADEPSSTLIAESSHEAFPSLSSASSRPNNAVQSQSDRVDRTAIYATVQAMGFDATLVDDVVAPGDSFPASILSSVVAMVIDASVAKEEAERASQRHGQKKNKKKGRKTKRGKVIPASHVIGSSAFSTATATSSSSTDVQVKHKDALPSHAEQSSSSSTPSMTEEAMERAAKKRLKKQQQKLRKEQARASLASESAPSSQNAGKQTQPQRTQEEVSTTSSLASANVSTAERSIAKDASSVRTLGSFPTLSSSVVGHEAEYPDLASNRKNKGKVEGKGSAYGGDTCQQQQQQPGQESMKTKKMKKMKKGRYKPLKMEMDGGDQFHSHNRSSSGQQPQHGAWAAKAGTDTRAHATAATQQGRSMVSSGQRTHHFPGSFERKGRVHASDDTAKHLPTLSFRDLELEASLQKSMRVGSLLGRHRNRSGTENTGSPDLAMHGQGKKPSKTAVLTNVWADVSLPHKHSPSSSPMTSSYDPASMSLNFEDFQRTGPYGDNHRDSDGDMATPRQGDRMPQQQRQQQQRQHQKHKRGRKDTVTERTLRYMETSGLSASEALRVLQREHEEQEYLRKRQEKKSVIAIAIEEQAMAQLQSQHEAEVASFSEIVRVFRSVGTIEVPAS